jgi:hypothetical protein
MEEVTDRELYEKIICHKTGVPKTMMEAICVRMTGICNEFLATIGDFRISIYHAGEIHVDLMINDHVISADLASGYQKFIIDIIMRQALCASANWIHPRILFIDEGFGAADEINFDIICRTILPALGRHFEKVIVISHINVIHLHTNVSCSIDVVNGRSQLRFGPMVDGIYNPQLIEERAIIKQNADQEKAVRKANYVAEQRRLKQEQATAITKKCADYADIVITRADAKHLQCGACNKIFKSIAGAAEKHSRSAGHVKAMMDWNPRDGSS